MLYCEKCERVLADETDICEKCGRKPRPPRENEPALLAETCVMHANMIGPLLSDTGIPFSKQGGLGAAFTMRAGTLLETYRFFVPCGVYAEARALLESAFGEDPGIMETLR